MATGPFSAYDTQVVFRVPWMFDMIDNLERWQEPVVGGWLDRVAPVTNSLNRGREQRKENSKRRSKIRPRTPLDLQSTMVNRSWAMAHLTETFKTSSVAMNPSTTTKLPKYELDARQRIIMYTVLHRLALTIVYHWTFWLICFIIVTQCETR